jgi:hypothetical protein
MIKTLRPHSKNEELKSRQYLIDELLKRGCSEIEIKEMGFVFNIQWDKAKVIALIKKNKYINIRAWFKDNVGSYSYARKQDWYDQVCSIYFKNKQIAWDKARVIAHIKKNKYINIGAWQKDDQSSYRYAKKQDWYEQLVNKFKLRQNKRRIK